MAFRFGPFIGAGLLLASSAAAATDAAARLDAWLAGLDTLSARFEQRLFDEDRNLIDQAGGTMLIDRPGRFRFDYETPPQLIVGDGARVWIYDPELAQVTVRDLDDALGSTPAVLLTSHRPVEHTFRIEAPDAGEGIERFDLEPKAAGDAPFARIRLAFTGGELRRMELVDQFGQTTLFGFDAVRRHPSIPSGAFTFTPPAGVDVVDAGRGR